MNSFDGYQFKIYEHDPSDSTSLLTNRIDYNFVDSEGRLWIQTDGKLSQYNQEFDNFTHHRYLDSAGVRLPLNNLITLYEDKDDSLWLVTSNGFYTYENNKWIFSK